MCSQNCSYDDPKNMSRTKWKTTIIKIGSNYWRSRSSLLSCTLNFSIMKFTVCKRFSLGTLPTKYTSLIHQFNNSISIIFYICKSRDTRRYPCHGSRVFRKSNTTRLVGVGDIHFVNDGEGLCGRSKKAILACDLVRSKV